MEKFWFWLAWKLPRRLVYWGYIRIHAAATCGEYSNLTPNEVSWDMALKSWEK